MTPDLGLPWPVGAVPAPPLVLDCGCSFGEAYEPCERHGSALPLGTKEAHA